MCQENNEIDECSKIYTIHNNVDHDVDNERPANVELQEFISDLNYTELQSAARILASKITTVDVQWNNTVTQLNTAITNTAATEDSNAKCILFRLIDYVRQQHCLLLQTVRLLVLTTLEQKNNELLVKSQKRKLSKNRSARRRKVLAATAAAVFNNNNNNNNTTNNN
jgi:hypothetical protein